MKITKDSTVPGKTIAENVGIVSAQYVTGMNIGKDMSALFKDFSGGRINGYEAAISDGRDCCLSEIQNAALSLGAHGLTSLSFEYCNIGKNGIFMISCTAVAVTFSA